MLLEIPGRTHLSLAWFIANFKNLFNFTISLETSPKVIHLPGKFDIVIIILLHTFLFMDVKIWIKRNHNSFNFDIQMFKIVDILALEYRVTWISLTQRAHQHRWANFESPLLAHGQNDRIYYDIIFRILKADSQNWFSYVSDIGYVRYFSGITREFPRWIATNNDSPIIEDI